MSDQAPAPRQDTSGAAGPAEDPGTQGQPQDDWQKRYSDLQPEYTRTAQERAELANWKQWAELAFTSDDPDTRRQALQALGYELPEEEEEFEPADYEDPVEAVRADVDNVRQRLDQQDEQARQSEEDALIRAITDERLGQLDGLDKDSQNWVLAYAINALPALHEPGVPVPLPDVQGAYQAFQAFENDRQKQWAKTKRAPFVPGGGQTATEVPNTDTHQGRVDAILRKMQDTDQAY